MAEQAVQAAASAAMDFSLCLPHGFSISLKIENKWVAAGFMIGAFYIANRVLTERAIRNSLQQQTPSGNADPEVTAISPGSILVQLTCYTEGSFLRFAEDIDSEKVKYRLEEELAKVGFSEKISLTVENNEEFEIVRKRFFPVSNLAQADEVNLVCAVSKPRREDSSSPLPKIRRQQSEVSHSHERYDRPSPLLLGEGKQEHDVSGNLCGGAMEIDQDIEPAHKRQRLEVTGGESVDSGEAECVFEIVFALDYSSIVSDDDFKRELNFVQHLAQSWNSSTELKVVVYGHDAKTLSLTLGHEQVFYGKSRELRYKTWAEGKNRRIDRALSVAAENFPAGAKSGLQPHKVVVMITAGDQQSDAQKKDNHHLLVKAHEMLSERNIKVIIVPVGLHTDFRELGLIVSRPQSLYPLCGFRDMTLSTAQGIGKNIKKTLDIEDYATNTILRNFSSIPETSGLWENISLCSDVLEGAWYLLYDDKKKPKKSETVKKFIRESIDTFQSTLVTESKIRISLAVFGPLGAGKSFFINSLLKWGLGLEERALPGPLPSSSGGSQTPIPIYVRYGRSLQVFLHSCSNEKQLLLQETDINAHTLSKVENVLKIKFQEERNILNAKYVEIEGQFPVFYHLKETTRAVTQSGHLELEVDVEFVDLPGCGDERGNESINLELNKADVVLFFDWGKSGRPVSAEDIAQLFRRHDEFEFTTRPKLVHVSNQREVSVPPEDEEKIYHRKKKDLKRAWSTFLGRWGEAASDCYQEVRAKRIPQLTGEALLEKLSSESDVIYFHSGSTSTVEILKEIIKSHVESVRMKETAHPFLKHIHLAAKKLKARIVNTIASSKTKHSDAKVTEINTSFDIIPCENYASSKISSFVHESNPSHQDSDLDKMESSICKAFFHLDDTEKFLQDMLRESLASFTERLIYNFTEAKQSMSENGSSDLCEVVEIMCKSRVQQFCTNSALVYLRKVVEKEVNRNRRNKTATKQVWSNAGEEKRNKMCCTFLHHSLERVVHSLEKPTPQLMLPGSHFQMIEQLKRDVQELLAVRSFDVDASKIVDLKGSIPKLRTVINFCHKTIRDINPHPSLDVQTDVSIPEKIVDAHEDNTIPSQSNHEKIINEMTEILLKPGSKGNDPVHKLEAKLKYKHGDLQLRQTQGVDQLEWAKALIIVLSDKDHSNVNLNPPLKLNQGDEENDRLLNFARKRLFAYQKSYVTCKMVISDGDPSIPDDEIRVRKSPEEKSRLKVLLSSKMSNMLDSIRDDFKDPAQQLAPVFMPSIRPGPSEDIRGNYFLQDDPWSRTEDESEEQHNASIRPGPSEDIRGNYFLQDDPWSRTEDKSEDQHNALNLSIFLVVEKHQLKQFRDTINTIIKKRRAPNNVRVVFIVLPQEGRGIGVTRAIIKSLAECFKFSLYWTIDDDIQFMFQFDENGRRWRKCAIIRGLLFGQRVFQTCLEKTVKELSDDERAELFEDVTSHWPTWAKKIKRHVQKLFIDNSSFEEVQRNPCNLHSPFARISEVCDGDKGKEEVLRKCERDFVKECRKRLYEESLNHIAGISLAHESTRRYDYMSKYPKADYMHSEQRYQIVLNNASALKERNFVTDEMIFREEENQVRDRGKRNTPYWGVRGSDKSFCRALKVSGVIGYQVIRIVHSHKKLINVFDKVAPSYIGSQSPHRSEEEEEEEEEDEPQAGPSHIQS